MEGARHQYVAKAMAAGSSEKENAGPIPDELPLVTVPVPTVPVPTSPKSIPPPANHLAVEASEPGTALLPLSDAVNIGS